MLDSTDFQRTFQPMPDASAPGAEVTDQTKIRVLIVDDHSVVRMGLRMFFDHQPDIEVVTSARPTFDFRRQDVTFRKINGQSQPGNLQ